MENKNFIKTSDSYVASVLRLSKYTCIEEKDGMWTFINDGNMKFSEEDNKKMIYTNILCV